MEEGKKHVVNWERAKAISGWVVAAVLATSLLGVAFAVNPSFNTIIQPGSMVEPVSYVAFKDGSNYFARNGNTGAIDYSGTSASTVLQAALNAVTTSPNGTLSIRAANWTLGATGLSVTTSSSHWSIDFEFGATLYYTGTAYAINISASQHGAIQYVSLNSPTIYTTSSGSGIYVKDVIGIMIISPFILTTKVGIDVEATNTMLIGDGGYISIPAGTGSYPAGSVGIRLGRFTYANRVTIEQMSILGFDSGIQVGPTTAGNYAEGIVIRDIDMENNNNAVILKRSLQVTLDGNWFEGSVNADINFDGAVTQRPQYTTISNTFFGGTVYAILVSNTSYATFIAANTGNRWASGSKVLIGSNVIGGHIDVTGATGTYFFNYGTDVHFYRIGDPQSGTHSFSTASATWVNYTATYPYAYPTGLTVRIQVTAYNPSDPASQYIIWVTAVTVTNFVITLRVTTAGTGGSTVSVVWSSSLA